MVGWRGTTGKRILVSIVGVVFLAIGSGIFVLDHLLRYRTLPGDDGAVPTTSAKPLCRKWHTDLEYRFGDGTPMPIDCPNFSAMEGESSYVQSASGALIHYRIPKSDLPQEAPIWLHVHGVTGSWLSAGKYQPVAGQLGFRLVAMDMSNHGQSSNDGSGAAWGCREDKDIIAVVEALSQRFPDSPLFLSASSMGTLAVLRAEPELRKSHVQMLLLEAPFPGILDVFHPLIRPLAFLTLKLRESTSSGSFKLCSAKESLAELKIPALIVTVVSDNIVPTSLSKSVFETIPESTPKRFRAFEKGIHTLAFNSNAEALTKELVSFFELTKSLDHPSAP